MEKNNGQSGHFVDGMLLGAVVGGAAVFLLGTTRGKKILKLITEEGVDGIENLLTDLQVEYSSENQEEIIPAEVVPDDVSPAKTEEKPEPTPQSSNDQIEAETAPKPPVRRFFKRSTK